MWIQELSLPALTVNQSCTTAPGKGADVAFRADLADAVVAGICDDDISVTIYCDTPQTVELRLCVLTINVSCGATPCKGTHVTFRANFADAVV
uniref:Uncharacterized protein n=1 Tax=Chromera velia CCMP2878 TaxID=1169474 RepID=A0A0G4HJC0_9ALVE|eukprot:Cvel_28220.t1-p1 / transcript=Cvel_28220.t1 / gene=Cvel_28220 / organism=Chromera_velia_CCMP2878 / gene_product=hypothetical protein / transcript_product=hypothetical protein / location=Cvel_scaffold3653:12808-13083(+) / protein_length=92 / sequence_SO=supercontig / SO=protein_coding / is_pseudo=false